MRRRGSALLEFAVAYPIFVLLVVAAVQLAIWGAELYAVRAAASQALQAGAAPGAVPGDVAASAARGLQPWLFGVQAGAWCSGDPSPQPALAVCVTRDLGGVVVDIRGSLPVLVAPWPGDGLKVAIRSSRGMERFT